MLAAAGVRRGARARGRGALPTVPHLPSLRGVSSQIKKKYCIRVKRMEVGGGAVVDENGRAPSHIRRIRDSQQWVALIAILERLPNCLLGIRRSIRN